MSRVSGFQRKEVTWDPSSIADGNEASLDVTVNGAKLGDFVMHSHEVDVSDLVTNATVTAADTVTVVLANNTGSDVDLASHTVNVKVVPKEVM